MVGAAEKSRTKSLTEHARGITRIGMTTRNAKYLLSLAAELEARIKSGDLRGYTVERLTKAAEYYRGQAAVISKGRVL